MRKLTVFFLLLFLTFVAGCISLKKTYPEKHQFMLDVPQRSTAANSSGAASVLLIRKLNVSPLYEGKGFVYFKGQHTYASDFYNEFFIEPGPMLTEALRKWLNSAGLFAHVLSKPGEILPDYILEGTVTALYGDYSQENQYSAVLGIQFFLINENSASSEIVLQKYYQRQTPFDSHAPESLVDAWNRGLREILTEFESDLGNITVKTRKK